MTANDMAAAGDSRSSSNRGENDRELVRRVLRERAENLARKRAVGDVEETTEFVTLDLAGVGYAVEASAVREVFALRDLTPLPTAPEWVLGITNVRGKIVAVIDLLVALGHGHAQRAGGQVVVVEVGGVEVGIDVAQCGVTRVPRGRVRPATAERGPYLKSVTVDDRGVLDLERIVADTRRTATPLATGVTA